MRLREAKTRPESVKLGLRNPIPRVLPLFSPAKARNIPAWPVAYMNAVRHSGKRSTVARRCWRRTSPGLFMT